MRTTRNIFLLEFGDTVGSAISVTEKGQLKLPFGASKVYVAGILLGRSCRTFMQ